MSALVFLFYAMLQWDDEYVGCIPKWPQLEVTLIISQREIESVCEREYILYSLCIISDFTSIVIKKGESDRESWRLEPG